MSGARPTVEEERWLALAARHPALRAAVATGARAGGWRTATPPSRCLFFVLGLFGSSLVGGLVVMAPRPGLVAGLVLVGLGEWLIRSRRAIHCGIEEAAWLAGAAALGFELLSSLEPDAAPAFALAAVVMLLIGARLLNPLFLAAGVLLAPVALAIASASGERTVALVAAVAYAIVGVAALVAGARPWRRPSYARAVDLLLVVAPAATYVCWLIAERPAAVALPAALGVAALAGGFRRRWQAGVWAAITAGACAVHAAWDALAMAPYWKLILLGAVLLGGGLMAERALRRPRGGITSRRIGAEGALPEVIEAAVVARLGAATSDLPPAPAGAQAVQGQGGEFGGGGATGRF